MSIAESCGQCEFQSRIHPKGMKAANGGNWAEIGSVNVVLVSFRSDLKL